MATTVYGTSGVSGLISGFDTETIISKMLEASQKPINSLNEQKSVLTNKLTAWQNINARLLALKMAAYDLQSLSAFEIKTASVSDASVMTVSPSSSAASGVYTLQVVQTAKAMQLGSDSNYAETSAAVGTGSITITNTKTGAVTTIDIAQGADALTNVVNAINNSEAGVQAGIINDGSGANPYRVILTSKTTGISGAFSVSTNLSGGAGISFSAPTSVITPADDAQIKLGSGANAITITKSSNTVTDVIPGATLNLLKSSGGSSVQVVITTDTAGIKNKIQSLVTAYNDFVSFANESSSYDSETQKSGALLGDYSLVNMHSSIDQLLTATVPGLPAASNTLSAIGVRIATNGTLTFDSSAFDKLMLSSPDNVARILARSGSATDASITFIGATERTKETTGSGYSVNITQLATKSRVTAGVAFGPTLAQSETLTINGVSIDLQAGTTLAQAVSIINAYQSQTGVTASATLIDGTGTGNFLTLTSTAYGSSSHVQAVSTVSNQLSSTSGIGLTVVNDGGPLGEAGTGTGATGVDVAGTINGELATGMGQILRGDSGNENTAGLSIMVTSTTTGDKGTITYNRGAGAALNDLLATLTEANTGSLALTQKGIQDQIDDYDAQMNDLIDRMALQETRIRAQFASMEATLGALKNQSSFLTAQYEAMLNSNKNK